MASFTERGTKLLLLVIIFAANAAHLGTSARLNEDLMMLAKHAEWMAQHGRVYKSIEEKEERFKIFKENLKFINEYNRATNGTYKMGLNHFADLTREEFLATYASGYKAPPPASKQLEDYPYTQPFRYENVNVADLPASMDWRDKGAVTPVKDQNPCGTCWAFAAVAAIEGINKIKTGDLISLSEQQILDCMGTKTCMSGGNPTEAFDYVSNNGGIATESDYPYVAVYQEACRASSTAAKINGYENVPSYDEVSLLKAMANQPVTVLIDASMLQYYSAGVMPSTPSGQLNHAVTLVGYGTDENGTKYWLAKNSWGQNWAYENGYFRVERDSGLSEGTLGIATHPSYPVI